MDKIKKNNSVKNRQRRLKNEYFLTNLLMIIGVFLGILLYITAAIYVFPILAVMLSLLKLDTFWYSAIMSGIDLFLQLIPGSVVFIARAKMEVLDEKYEYLDEFVDVNVVKKTKKISKKDEEKQKVLFDEILAKIDRLPRNKQVDILNYIKGDLTSNVEEIGIQINELSEDNIEKLQDRVEDVVFSNFDKDDDPYTRCKKK